MNSIGLWHVTEGGKPNRLLTSQVPAESTLEGWIEADPSLISPTLHAVRRQAPLGTKRLDLLAVEAPGVWVICELKRIQLERDVLSQALDYAARISEMSLEDFRDLVKQNYENLPFATQELIDQGLQREEDGEARELRIVLTGVGVKEELTRMVSFLGRQHGVPIQVCTLSALAAPGGDGLILMRDTSADIDPDLVAEASGSSYEQRMDSVRNHFRDCAVENWLDSIIEIVGRNENLYIRPWKKSLMIAPARNHARYLMYLNPQMDSVVAQFGVEPIEEFFPGSDLQLLESIESKKIFVDSPSLTSWIETLSSAIGADAGATKGNDQGWNGKDWYVAFGEEDATRFWDEARRIGFVSAGGGDWYSRTLRGVPVGARIFVYIPKVGYVGCGETLATAVTRKDADFLDGELLKGHYESGREELEYFIPVRWINSVPREQAFKEPNLFANQNSACRLRDTNTLNRLYDFFGVNP